MQARFAQVSRPRNATAKKGLRYWCFIAIPASFLAGLVPDVANAQQVFQPPGANLTFGDVAHGMRAQSASSNPAAAAADLAREGDKARSGAVVSVATGIEYGNIQDIWDFYDEISRAFSKSDPDENIGGPGQDPDDKPDEGIDLGDIWDLVDPEIQQKVEDVAAEVATQAGILALIGLEGYGKAWVAVDAPILFRDELWGGAWTLQLHWSGAARAFGLTDAIEFSKEDARDAIEEWFDREIADRPTTLQLGSKVRLFIDALGNVSLSLQNDSMLLAKSSRLSALSTSYSRVVWSGDAGTLFAGLKGQLYNLQLSRYGVRFGDITDSEELFDEIRNADYVTDTRLGLDFGLLWVGENYQVGAQLRSINEPDFRFPVLDLPLVDTELQAFVQQDRIYTMERQVKLEASMFSPDRRWSFHLAGDANSAIDPVGSAYQWLTASIGRSFDNNWFPGVRIGYRENLAGTEKSYVGIGATLFKYLNLDISSALDSTTVDGNQLPEGLMVSLGFQVSW